ncbi:hypothetical protein PG993_006148 [Apiospora rasikravindrae]|uniref:Uncharacterized protein n=1 Tax=Apiospora rasikravindrae TaxID=990691 RepID=A0ABR1TAU4_9PEZI
MESDCVGIIQVPVSLLTFSPTPEFPQASIQQYHSQEQLLRLDWGAILKLVETFRAGHCSPAKPDHHMRGVVTPELLNAILLSLGLSQDELIQKSAKEQYPFVSGNFQIWCIQGLRRALAAKTVFQAKACWVVRLFCKPAGPDRDLFIRNESEAFLQEVSFSDGAIYRKVRHYADKKDYAQCYKWIRRLSTCKRKNLLHLLRQKPLPDKLDKQSIIKSFDLLLPFTGLWDGLELGNIHKHLALHCDEQIIHFIQHIRRSWNHIFQGLEAFLQNPSASQHDRELITKAMADGQLFPLITKVQQRKRLLHNILSLTVVIPSIKTFHENMKYFSIGAKIVQEHVGENYVSSRKGPRLTLMRSVLRDWRQPAGKVENGEGHYYLTEGPMTEQLAYTQLFLSALRHFPRLSNESPRQDRRGEVMNAKLGKEQLKRFCDGARQLGFGNPKLDHPAQVDIVPDEEDLLHGGAFFGTCDIKPKQVSGDIDMPTVVEPSTFDAQTTPPMDLDIDDHQPTGLLSSNFNPAISTGKLLKMNFPKMPPARTGVSKKQPKTHSSRRVSTVLSGKQRKLKLPEIVREQTSTISPGLAQSSKLPNRQVTRPTPRIPESSIDTTMKTDHPQPTPESSNIINSGLGIPSDLPSREIARPTPQKPRRLLTPQQPQRRPNPSLQVEASQITSKPGTKRRLDSLYSSQDGEDTREHEATESQVASVIEDMPHLPSREAVRSVPARRIPQISGHHGNPRRQHAARKYRVAHWRSFPRSPERASDDDTTAVVSPVNDQGGETTEPQGSGQSQNRSHSLARDAMHTKDDNPQPTHRSSADKLTTSALNRRAGSFSGGSSLNQLNTTSSSGNQAGISESGTIATIQVQSEYDLFTDESSIDDQEEPAEPTSPTSDDSILY